MPVVRKSALVHHSASEMYRLVCDFEAYPEFLPWCTASRLISRQSWLKPRFYRPEKMPR